MLKRTMLQLYLIDCDQAIELYQAAFGATVHWIERNPEDNTIIHAEILAFGQTIAFSERKEQTAIGNTMQFCFHFDAGDEERVKRAYEALKNGADIHSPLGPCAFSPCMFGLVDKFGVDWCIFAA